MLTSKISKIFIVHYKPLHHRKKYLLNYFNQYGIDNFEFRDLYQRDHLTKELTNEYFKLDNLNPAQICITIEHIETYKEIVKTASNDDDWYLILEDDSIFCHNFIELMNTYLNNVPNDAEYLDVNDYMSSNSNNMWEQIPYTRTTCSYLIKPSTCKKLLSTIIPFEFAIDHENNKQIKIHNIKTYWSNIPLVIQGSTQYGSSYVQH